MSTTELDQLDLANKQICRNCKHWQDAPDPFDRFANVKYCMSPKLMHGDKARRPDGDLKVLIHEDPEHVFSDDDAAVVDGSGFLAALMPCAEFGCVNWTKKEGE